MSTETLFEQYVHALNTRDREAAFALVADPLEHNGELMPAHQWWSDHVMANVDCIDGYTWTVDELVVAGDRVTVRYTDSGTLVRPWVGLTAVGTPIAFREYVLYTVRDGRIVTVWSVFDHWSLVGQTSTAQTTGGPGAGTPRPPHCLNTACPRGDLNPHAR